MRPFWKTAAVAGACAACCAAPLAVVPIAASLGLATAGLAFASKIGTAIALAAVAFGIHVWRRRKAVRACRCDADAGCNTDESCRIPAPAGTGNGS